MGKPGRKKTDKTAIRLQQFLGSSKGPEEMLFKLNEFLYGQEFQALRKNPRIPANFPLIWKLRDKEQAGASYTISREGMFIKTPKPARPKSFIEVRFCLPGQRRDIIAKGEVVTCVRMKEAMEKGLVSGMAVVFKEIDPGSQKLLDSFITERSKKIYLV